MHRCSRSIHPFFVCAFVLLTTPASADPPKEAPPPPTPPDPPAVAANDQKAATATEAAALKEVGKATQAARDAADSAKAAQDEVANARSGKLISSGITAGIAAVAHVPFDNAIKTTAVGSMPYVMAHPAYWSSAHAQNTYCASNWTLGGDEHAASQAAYAIAKKQGERSFQAAENVLRPYAATATTMKPDDFMKVKVNVMKTYISSADDQAELAMSAIDRTITWLRFKMQPNADADWIALERASIVELIATLSWNPVWPGACLSRKFGFWVGLPLKYETTTELGIGNGTDARGKRDVSPTIALGLGFSPNAYLSILAGISINTIARAANPAVNAPAGDVSAVTFVAGLGGNLDVLTLLKP